MRSLILATGIVAYESIYSMFETSFYSGSTIGSLVYSYYFKLNTNDS